MREQKVLCCALCKTLIIIHHDQLRNQILFQLFLPGSLTFDDYKKEEMDKWQTVSSTQFYNLPLTAGGTGFDSPGLTIRRVLFSTVKYGQGYLGGATQRMFSRAGRGESKVG